MFDLHYPCIVKTQCIFGQDVLDRIAWEIMHFQNRFDEPIIITGDMNGNSRELLDYIENDHAHDLPLPDDYTEDILMPVSKRSIV